MKKLELAYLGNPILRKKARPVEAITPEIVELVEDMIVTMQAHRGAGLAAPQVSHSLRIFVIQISNDDNLTEEEFAKIVPEVFINPRLFDPSETMETHSEACLSIPRVRAALSRPQSIKVEALNLQGESFTMELTGWRARAVMHENDHINGVLFIDRLAPAEKRRVDALLKAFKRK